MQGLGKDCMQAVDECIETMGVRVRGRSVLAYNREITLHTAMQW